MNRFYRDRYKQTFEEVQEGRIRAVTAADGTRYVQDQTVSKTYWEGLRGPLVEVPDPWMTPETKLLRVQDVVERWETNHPRGTVLGLLAEIHTALGHAPEQEEK